MVDIAQQIHTAVAAVAPISGVSVGDPNNRATWSIRFKEEATAQERVNAQSALQNLQLVADHGLDFLSFVYPIGSIYLSTTDAHPGTLFNFGTWEAIASGRMLIGLDANDGELNAAAKIGGTKTVTLTEAQLPVVTVTQQAHTHLQDAHTHVQDAHNHIQNSHFHTLPVGPTDDTVATFDRADAGSNASGANATTNVGTTTATNQAATATNQNATAVNQTATAVNNSFGGGQAHSNMPPFYVVFMFRRTS